MSGNALATREPQPEWDDELPVKQRRLVKAVISEAYDTLQEAAKAAGYADGSLDSTIYTVWSSYKVQRAFELCLAQQRGAAKDFRQVGETAMQRSLDAALRDDLAPAAKFILAEKAARYGLDKERDLGVEEQPVNATAAQAAYRQRILKAMLIGSRHPAAVQRRAAAGESTLAPQHVNKRVGRK